MPSDFTRALRDEVRRLARREIRRNTASTKRAVSDCRRDIAALKRSVKALEKKLALLQKEEKRRLGEKPPAKLAEGARFSPLWLKKHRARLGLSAADYARLVGVHQITVYNWEQGKSKPRKEQLAALVAVRRLGKRDARERLEIIGKSAG